MKKIFVSDYTLKQLAAERNTALLFREKTAIATSIDAYGADAVELPAMKNVKEDTVINKTIAMVVKKAAVAIPVSSIDMIEPSYDSIKTAVRPVLQVEMPVSTVTMEYMYSVKSDRMLTMIEELIGKAVTLCENTEFIAGDAGRAEREFLLQACSRAEELGVKAVTLCDTAGTLLPEEVAELVADVRKAINVKLYVQVSDALHMAVAAACEAVKAGADGVKCSAAGKDVMLTGDFADLVAVRGEAAGISTGLDQTRIHRDIRVMMDKVAAEHIASAEVDGEDAIFLDADSSLTKVGEAAERLGYDLTPEDLGKVHQAMRSAAELKGTLGTKELEALIASYAMQAPSTYHLEGYNASSSSLTNSMAHVILKKDGEEYSGIAIGDGPIDAAFMAIEQIVGYHYELDEFQIQAVTEGKEALGATLVRLRSGGRLYSGNGLSTDIIGSAIRAYINALNKIVYEENK